MSSNDESRSAADAAINVVNTLQALAQEERARVLNSVAALFGVSLGAGHAERGRADPKEAGAGGSDNPSGKRISIVELLQDKSPATNTQRIATFAYYHEKYEGNEHFSKADMSPYFAKAKLPKPGNFDRDYAGAIREGWIHDDGASSYLTQKGEAAVVAGFGGKGKARGAAARKKKTAKSE